ncbi:MtnX-like HAD-IB family phosphatase [bacterium]|nr:MtnX-like HAD-IB family phosphatase [bacterium]
MQTVYFVDFDHTISRQDVWDYIVKTYASHVWEDLVRRYIDGELTSRQCNQRVAEELVMPEEIARREILDIGIDPAFPAFANWTRDNNLPMSIVSDGYDYYINLLLKENNLDWIPSYCNQMTWKGDRVEVAFPWSRPTCERDMASCKCQHVEKAEGKRRVYVGDGISDACAAPKCEVVYAKRGLLDHCVKHGVEHIAFDSFAEILEREQKWFESQTHDPQSILQ